MTEPEKPPPSSSPPTTREGVAHLDAAREAGRVYRREHGPRPAHLTGDKWDGDRPSPYWLDLYPGDQDARIEWAEGWCEEHERLSGHRRREGGLDPDPPDPGATARGLAPHTFLAMWLLLVAVFCRGDALLFVVSALLIVSAWAAWLLARVDARHRPVAQGLVAMAACMLVREGLHASGALSGGPYTGWARAAFHVEEATRLATAALPAWMAVRVLTKWPPGPTSVKIAIVAAFQCAWLAMIIWYPELRGDALRRVYLGAELAALFVALLAIASWLRKSVALRRGVVVTNLMRPPWFTWATILALVGGDLVLLPFGAWRWGLFGDAYVVQQAGLLAVWGLVALLQGASIVMAGRRA